MTKIRCAAAGGLPGHHVDAVRWLDRVLVKAEAPPQAWRSEATSLDEGEPSRRIQRVMARFVVRAAVM